MDIPQAVLQKFFHPVVPGGQVDEQPRPEQGDHAQKGEGKHRAAQRVGRRAKQLAVIGQLEPASFCLYAVQANAHSGGQQQRAAIARALAAKPALVLADEPTGNLDSRTSQEVMGLLKTTSQELAQTVIMITHNEEIAQLADRIIHIEDGKIAGGEANV